MFREKLIRPELKILDATKGFVQAVLSTEDEDSEGDIIRQNWQMDRFNDHPVVLANHDYSSIRSVIGKWSDVQVKSKRLIGTAELFVAAGNEQADWAFYLAQKGMLAFSVGFAPIKYAERTASEGKQSYWGNFEFTESELLECSAVTIPANRNALQLMARSKGLSPMLDGLVREALADEHTPADADPVPGVLLEATEVPDFAALIGEAFDTRGLDASTFADAVLARLAERYEIRAKSTPNPVIPTPDLSLAMLDAAVRRGLTKGLV